MTAFVLDLWEIDRTDHARVGGKAAGLGELMRVEGLRVPPGFCVTTDAFRRVVGPSVRESLDRLARVHASDTHATQALAAGIRAIIEGVAVPEDVRSEIIAAVSRLGEEGACAVRSSATAEDLPTASFAGQQDTWLNVVGPDSIVRHVVRCWASLFSDRAVTYRVRNGIDHRSVHMAVVVQRMVVPRAAGVMFTADPVTGNRNVVTIEAVFGLGETLVSGEVSPDVYGVRDGEVISRNVGTKSHAVVVVPGGGTREQALDAERRAAAVLTDAECVRIAELGRCIEAHFGSPQDIEWCLADDDAYIVQSRPITTLFPVPDVDDDARHVYLSVGHQQMMTDAMKPLGISFWQMTAGRPMYEAGARLFVDVTDALATQAGRAGLLGMAGRSDPLVGDALRTVIERDFIPLREDVSSTTPPGIAPPPAAAPGPATATPPVANDPGIVEALIERSESSIRAAEEAIRTKSGPELFDFILADIEELRRILFDPEAHRALMAGMEAAWWLNDRMEEWLGERNVADVLTQSVPGNVTSEMGLALLDVADVIRPHPEVVAFLERVDDDDFLDALVPLEGGRDVRDAIVRWLDRYGVRCVGEIDITRPRWIERPSTLLPLILAHVRSFEPGEAERRFEQGRREAMSKKHELLERLRALPDGEEKAAGTERMIERVRTFAGYREYPKYGMISRYFVYRRALLAEAVRLVEAGVLREVGDIFHLTFRELHDVVRTQRSDPDLIRERRDRFRLYRTLTPPRVLTSEGEAITGSYRREDVPADALVGLPVSAGVVEGRARVIIEMADADLEPGDILVTTFTDPSWTPLFVSISGLVTEVGGLMSHGSVIAREYGLPAVVGVEHATGRIRDGDMIRVHGTDGYVEIMSGSPHQQS